MIGRTANCAIHRIFLCHQVETRLLGLTYINIQTASSRAGRATDNIGYTPEENVESFGSSWPETQELQRGVLPEHYKGNNIALKTFFLSTFNSPLPRTTIPPSSTRNRRHHKPEMTSPLTSTLSGSCSCGRNKFTITPKPLTEEPDPAYGPPPHLFYCNCSQCRRQHASPLIPEVRLPITWTTYSTHPTSATETPESILKIHHSTPGVVERRFCGYCGTPMSYWSSATDEEKAILYIPIATLSDESQKVLVEQVGPPELHFHWGSGAGWFQKLLVGSEVVKGGKFQGGVESEMVQ